MPGTSGNRSGRSPSRRREQRQSSRRHRHTTVRPSKPSSSRIPSRPHRRPAPETQDVGDTRQAIIGRKGNDNDVDEDNDFESRQQAIAVLFNRTLGYHVDDGKSQLRTGPHQLFHDRDEEDPQQGLDDIDAATGTANMANGHGGHYPQEVGDELSMIPVQGSAYVSYVVRR